jgi:pimeloyl-ACP methyl ester carboxylesterase
MGAYQRAEGVSSAPQTERPASVRPAGPGNAAAAERFMGPQPQGAGDIPRQDMIYENLAHAFGYGGHDKGPAPTMLKAWGYGQPEIIHGEGGFSMTIYPVKGPTENSEGPLRPVISFQGTDPTSAADLAADLDPGAVGATQLMQNEEVILKALRRLGGEDGRVDLVGHSLGGSLAQLVAAAHPEFTGRVTAFQAPGVPGHVAHRIAGYNKSQREVGGHEIETTYHLLDTDQVHRAGEKRLPGQTWIHQNDARNPVSAHTSHMLAQGGRHRLQSSVKRTHGDEVTPNVDGSWQEGTRDWVGRRLGRQAASDDFERWSTVRSLFKDGHLMLDEVRSDEHRTRLGRMYPEIWQMHQALGQGGPDGVKGLLDKPPRDDMRDTDRDRVQRYIDTWNVRGDREPVR